MTLAKRKTAGHTAWFDSWRLAAASTTGASHLARAIENQDSFQTNITVLKDPTQREVRRNEPLIICVADGLGSNRHSAAGAALATALGQSCAADVFGGQKWNVISKKTMEILLRTTCRQVRESWLTAVSAPSSPRRAPSHARPLRRGQGLWRPSSGTAGHPFHTTLVLAVLRPPWLGVAQIGDGFVVAQRGNGQCVLVERRQESFEYANTVSTLGQRPSEVSFTVLYGKDIRGLAVGTDGLEDSVLTQSGTARPVPKDAFFTTVFTEVASGERDSERIVRMLRSPALRAETDDDLTLVVASRYDHDRA